MINTTPRPPTKTNTKLSNAYIVSGKDVEAGFRDKRYLPILSLGHGLVADLTYYYSRNRRTH